MEYYGLYCLVGFRHFYYLFISWVLICSLPIGDLVRVVFGMWLVWLEVWHWCNALLAVGTSKIETMGMAGADAVAFWWGSVLLILSAS